MSERIPICWKSVASETGKRAGRLFFSRHFGWVVEDGNDPQLACVTAPKGAYRIERVDGVWHWVVEG